MLPAVPTPCSTGLPALSVLWPSPNTSCDRDLLGFLLDLATDFLRQQVDGLDLARRELLVDELLRNGLKRRPLQRLLGLLDARDRGFELGVRNPLGGRRGLMFLLGDDQRFKRGVVRLVLVAEIAANGEPTPFSGLPLWRR